MRKRTVDSQKDLDDRKTELQDCVQQARDLEDDILVSLFPFAMAKELFVGGVHIFG